MIYYLYYGYYMYKAYEYSSTVYYIIYYSCILYSYLPSIKNDNNLSDWEIIS